MTTTPARPPRRLIATVTLAALAAVGGCRSLARQGGFAGSLNYQAAALVRAPAADDDTAAPPRGQGELTVRLAAMMGRRIGPLFGLSLAGGAGGPVGASYDVALVPLGIGVKLHRTSFVGVGLALAAAGGTYTDDALVVAGQAYAEIALGRRLRWLNYARLGRDQVVSDAVDRHRVEVITAVRLGDRWDEFVASSNGYYLGVTWRQQQDAQSVGLVIGHSLDAGR